MLNRNLFKKPDPLMLQPFLFGEFEGRRRVASFGFRYDYDVRQLQRQPTPSRWRNRCKHRDSRTPCNPDSAALCTEYDVGVGVGWHRDKLHFDMIFGLSLNICLQVDFAKGPARHGRRRAPVALYDDRRVSTNMGTQQSAVQPPRYSITFRTMTNGPDPRTLA